MAFYKLTKVKCSWRNFKDFLLHPEIVYTNILKDCSSLLDFLLIWVKVFFLLIFTLEYVYWF